MKPFAILIVWAALAHAGCIELDSPRIRAVDLAAAVPLLQSLDAEAILGFSPLPGSERVLTGRELKLFAQRQGLRLDEYAIPNVCVERRVGPLLRTDLQNAMVPALGALGAQMELLEYSNELLPPGRLEFKLTGLNKPPAAAPQNPVIWRGNLIYDGDHSANIWARVRISVETSWFVAAKNISAGRLITAEDVQAIHGREFPLPREPLVSAGEIVGKVARKHISAGQRFLPSSIDDPPDVTRGERVGVKAMAGGAVLTLEAVAESSGKKGDRILIHNPVSGRNFRAVVQDKGQVVAETIPGT